MAELADALALGASIARCGGSSPSMRTINWSSTMDLLSLALGVAIGAAFAPFWMNVWAKIKTMIQSNSTPPKP